VVERRHELDNALVPEARLDADGPLCRRRPKDARIEDAADLALPAEPVEPGDGEERRVRDSVAELPEPRIDIAAERHDREVGPLPPELRATPDRRGAQPGAARQRVE